MNALRSRRFQMRCAAFLLLLATFVIRPLHVARPVYDVIAVLDITASMNTRDVKLDGAPSTRIAFEKRAVQDLLSALPMRLAPRPVDLRRTPAIPALRTG